MKLLHKGIEYEVLVNDPVDSNYNEDLNSATCLLENSDVRINFEILDEVRLGDDFYFCIASYEERMVNPASPHYDYTITLVSQAKEFENYILPNLTITKTKNNLTVYDYIDRYLKLYGKKVRDSNHHLVDAWNWDALNIDKFKVLCPEMQWSRPTLREVLTDLMMVVDCIPTLNNGVIGCLDLTERKYEEVSGITSVNRSKSLEDYATDIEMELQNVIQDGEEGVYNLTNAVEYTGFRNEDEYALNTNNALVYTTKPIYRIKHFWMCFVAHIIYRNQPSPSTQIDAYKWVEVDLCKVTDDGITYYNLLREYKEWISKPIVYDLTNISEWKDVAKYQNLCLVYNRGGNSIDNFFNENKVFWFDYKSNINTYIDLICKKVPPPDDSVDVDKIEIEGSTLKDVSFKIEYECLDNTKFRASKYLPYQNERTIIDNQTYSLVNANKQGLLEYMKANRLGNEMLIINARYDSLDSDGLVDVGNVYENDYIIFKRQMKINPNYVSVVYYATKNYVLKNYYTGVKSKIRSWKIDDENTVVRNEIHKYYYEFSFEPLSYGDDLVIPTRYMLSPFMDATEVDKIKYAVIRTGVGNGEFEPIHSTNNKYQWVITQLNSKVMGNSLVFSTQLKDNYSAGIFIDGEQNVNGTTYPVEKDARYVNEIGEFESILFKIGTERNILNDEGQFEWPVIINHTVYGNYSGVIDESIIDNHSIQDVSFQKPLAFVGYMSGGYDDTYYFNKDQREIVALTIQLEYCSDTEDIVFSNRFVRDNMFVTTNYRRHTTVPNQERIDLKMWRSYKKVRIYDTDYLPDDKIECIDWSFNLTSTHITINLGDDINANAYYITDNSSNPNVLLAFNRQTNTSEQIIYLNGLKSRLK